MYTNQLSKYRFFFFCMLSFSILVMSSSCKGDDDMEPGGTEEELITTLRLNFTQGSETLTFSFQDVDGDGGDPPNVDDIVLKAGAIYVLTAEVLDESKSPAEDITEEVEMEKDDHLFVYTASGANLTVTITDQDSNGQPVGLSAGASTGAASTGTLKVVLKHEPDKTAADPSTTGETDIEVTFNVRIE